MKNNALGAVLFLISGAVALVIFSGQNAWPLIAAYWLVLVVKNGVEVLGK